MEKSTTKSVYQNLQTSQKELERINAFYTSFGWLEQWNYEYWERYFETYYGELYDNERTKTNS